LKEKESMRIGIASYIQNYADWPRFLEMEHGADGPPLTPNTDAQFFKEGLQEALVVDQLGFDTLYVVEHHVSPYTMIPSPLAFLSYVAGATKRIDVGTMVVVVPWHNPLRLAEELSMLQLMLGDRSAFIGLGRGLARREYSAYGVNQSESRERFNEGVEIVKLALANDHFSYNGQFFQYENVTMRPRPLNPEKLIEDMHFAWGSPPSAPIGAMLGLKAMIIPQKENLEDYHDDLAQIARVHADLGKPLSRPRLHMHMYCDRNLDRAEEAVNKHVREHLQSSLYNYETQGDHFKNMKGYEHYAARAEAGLTLEKLAKPWIDHSIWGTPERCLTQIQALCDLFHPEELMLTGRFGTMTFEEGINSLELFAEEVLPAAHQISYQDPITYEVQSVKTLTS
jgi:alkanesulfonate monooxygenase SsuD/methylene tetrahydromethanopterin reductase-like flavin-dependent oxidoreductase (luciferase family)